MVFITFSRWSLCALGMLFHLAVQAQTRVITKDITHFWQAYDLINATSDTAEQRRILNTHFLDVATPGQLGMIAARSYTANEYLHAIRSYPRFYASIRPNMVRAADHAEMMRSGAAQLHAIFPAMKPADIYFTVGVFRSGGTVMDGNVLIGSEISLADSTTVTDEFPEGLSHLSGFFATNPSKHLAFTNVHELIHTQQPGRWGYDLLSQCLHEGIAEFIPTLAMGRPSPNGMVRFGEDHADTVRTVFEEELFSPWIDRWIWNDTSGPFPVRDLGYYVGYTLARSYYERSADKAAAVAELIGLNCEDRAAVEAFADRCGYLSKPLAELRLSYQASRPEVIRVSEISESGTVDPNLRTITIHFDRPMHKSYRSTGYGESGASAFPKVNDVIFANDGRSVTYHVELEPDKLYQFVLEEGFRDERSRQLQPFRVNFSTMKKR